MIYANSRRAFTLVELLVVITILGVLMGLLLPAIMSARDRARAAQTEAQINILGFGLAQFRQEYGEYPPSRLIFHESGKLGTPPTEGQYFSGFNHASPYANIGGSSLGPHETSDEYREVMHRSLAALRTFFPRMNVNTNVHVDGSTPLGPNNSYYDINGNGLLDEEPILLDGSECLYLFLCGVPDWEGDQDSGFVLRGSGGFDRNPRNPFTKVPPMGVTEQRTRPLYDGQLYHYYDDDGDGVPGIVDTIGTDERSRYLAYFSTSFLNRRYDPRDMQLEPNSIESYQMFGYDDPVPSIGPNPLTNGPTIGTMPRWFKPQTYQLFSAGIDRTYGRGGDREQMYNRKYEDDNLGFGTK